MAAEHDSEVALAAEDGSGPIWNRCLLCGTDLELDWPDLADLNPCEIKHPAHDEWRRAAAAGCPFCNIVIAVIDDAGKQHGCSVREESRLGSGGFQVILAPNESTGRYLLAVEDIWMPLLVEPGRQNEFWGIITVYLEGPDMFKLNLEPYSEIPRLSDSDEALKNARDWLTTCQNNHPDCSLVPNRDEHLPALDDPSIRILQISEDELVLRSTELCQPLPSYVALSHCWGSCPTLKTLSTNIERFRIGIQVQDLPLTFKDAVKTARTLGFEYIWIDSLCIVQDSPIDWEEQSSLMAFIYGNADLVLAASRALSTEDGFLKERKAYRESTIRLPGVRNKDRALALRYRLLQKKNLAPMVDPLDQRAWALQERILARRYLAIGSHDMSWTCKASLVCECEWWRVALKARLEVLNIESVLQNIAGKQVGFLWREYVMRHYQRRGLTIPSDNLVAVSAIASVFQAKSGQNYHAGIWQGDLKDGLLWGMSLGRDAAYATDHSAPSWSWASLPTLDFGVNFGTSRGSEALVRFLETKTTTSTMNKFGSVRSGFIRIWGRIWRAEIPASELLIPARNWSDHPLKVKGYFENNFRLHYDMSLIMVDVCLPDGTKERSMRRVRREEVQKRFFIGNLQDREIIHLFLIPLRKADLSDRDGLKRNRTDGLILGRSCKHPAKFHRLGNFSTDNLIAVNSRAHHEDNMDDFGEQEIVII